MGRAEWRHQLGVVAFMSFVVAVSLWSQAQQWESSPVHAFSSFLVGVGFALTACLLFFQSGQRGNTLLFGALALCWTFDQSTLRPIGALAAPAFLLGGFEQVLAAAALLRYPSDRFDRVSRAFVWVNVAIACVIQVTLMVTGRPQWLDLSSAPWPSIWPQRSTTDLLLFIKTAWWSAAAAIFICLLWRRWSRLGVLERRTLSPILISALIAAFAVGTAVFQTWLPPSGDKSMILFRAYAATAVSLAFVLSALQLRMARSAVADLATSLSGPFQVEKVREALRQTLADPELDVLYWVPERGEYVTSEGDSAALPANDEVHLVVEALTADGLPLAAVVADPSLARHRSLVDAAVSVSRLALENAQLQASLRSQLIAVQEARARLLHSGLEQRRRLERDLHDGAQQRLLAIGMRLGAIETFSPDPETAEAVQLARKELHLALEELRDLAHGLYPAILTQAGLGPAIEAVAERLPVPVRATVPSRRWHPDVESAAYLVACETLTNAAKYAGPCTIDLLVEESDDDLVVNICDDGVGYQQSNDDSDLGHLRDRLSALGGQLTVATAPGTGTRVRASIPCG